jgi:hypothetical protein
MCVQRIIRRSGRHLLNDSHAASDGKSQAKYSHGVGAGDVAYQRWKLYGDECLVVGHGPCTEVHDFITYHGRLWVMVHWVDHEL